MITTIKRLFSPRSNNSGTSTRNVRDWFVRALTYGESDTGIDVDGFTVLRSGPVWQAVNTIAGDIARLPLNCERADGTIAVNHPAHQLLAKKPNIAQIPVVFKETLQSWALLWGNGCALIDRDRRGTPLSLIPLRPDKVAIDLRENRPPRIKVTDANGNIEFHKYEDIFHISGLGDGFWGYAVWELSENTVGHNLALQKHGNRQLKNDSKPAGVLEADEFIDAKSRSNLRDEWEEMHQGPDNAGKIALLQMGVKFKPTQIANVDAQWIEARRFSREEIANWFQLPPHKVGALENASVRANLEEQNRDYWNSALSRWATKWQQEADRKLLKVSEFENETRRCSFDMTELLRGDSKTRSEGYASARQWGWLSVNEIRKRERLPSIGPEGDTYLTPTNMTDDPSGAPAGAAANSAVAEEAESGDTINDTIRELIALQIEHIEAVESDRIPSIIRRDDWQESLATFYNESYTKWLSKLELPMRLSLEVNCADVNWSEHLATYCRSNCLEIVNEYKRVSDREIRATQVRALLDTFSASRVELLEKLTQRKKGD